MIPMTSRLHLPFSPQNHPKTTAPLLFLLPLTLLLPLHLPSLHHMGISSVQAYLPPLHFLIFLSLAHARRTIRGPMLVPTVLQTLFKSNWRRIETFFSLQPIALSKL